MARVIQMPHLDEDVTIDLGSVRYAIPASAPAVSMMRLAEMQDELVSNQQALDAGEEIENIGPRQIELVRDLDAEVLALLRIRQPDLEATGLSSEQLGWMLGAILAGFPDSASEAVRPTPRRASKRAPAGAKSA